MPESFDLLGEMVDHGRRLGILRLDRARQRRILIEDGPDEREEMPERGRRAAVHVVARDAELGEGGGRDEGGEGGEAPRAADPPPGWSAAAATPGFFGPRPANSAPPGRAAALSPASRTRKSRPERRASGPN